MLPPHLLLTHRYFHRNLNATPPFHVPWGSYKSRTQAIILLMFWTSLPHFEFIKTSFSYNVLPSTQPASWLLVAASTRVLMDRTPLPLERCVCHAFFISLVYGGAVLKIKGTALGFKIFFIFKPRDFAITICPLKWALQSRLTSRRV